MADETTPKEEPKAAPEPAPKEEKSFGAKVTEQLARGLSGGLSAFFQAGTTGASGAQMLTSGHLVEYLLSTPESRQEPSSGVGTSDLQKLPRAAPVQPVSLKFTKITTGLGPEVDRVLTVPQTEVATAINTVYNVLGKRISGVEDASSIRQSASVGRLNVGIP